MLILNKVSKSVNERQILYWIRLEWTMRTRWPRLWIWIHFSWWCQGSSDLKTYCSWPNRAHAALRFSHKNLHKHHLSYPSKSATSTSQELCTSQSSVASQLFPLMGEINQKSFFSGWFSLNICFLYMPQICSVSQFGFQSSCGRHLHIGSQQNWTISLLSKKTWWFHGQ